jgi:hypothetical protein
VRASGDQSDVVAAGPLDVKLWKARLRAMPCVRTPRSKFKAALEPIRQELAADPRRGSPQGPSEDVALWKVYDGARSRRSARWAIQEPAPASAAG